MASTNIFTRFTAINAPKPQFRAEVVQVDSVSKRVKVTYTGFDEWVNGVANLNEFVLVQDGKVLSILPDLPYLETEI